jgi:hypothetical protein
MTTPTDDQLRDALAAEAEGITASDDLLARIRAERGATPATRRRRSAPWLLAAAAVLAVLGLGVFVLAPDGDDSEGLDVVDDPAPSPEATEAPSTTEAPTTTEATTTSGPPAADEPPVTIAAVREDGWLVLIDRTTGEQRELYFYADPNAVDEVGMTYFVDGVELSHDGEWIYFSTCCEPASGVTYRIAADGSQTEPERLAFMAYPRLSPDGRFLVGGSGHLVSVTAGAPAPEGSEPVAAPGPDGAASIDSHETGCCPRDFAWSPDGGSILYTLTTGAPGEVPEVMRLDFDGSTLSPADMGKPENPGEFPNWMPDGTPMIYATQPGLLADEVRAMSRDASYRWILRVNQDGTVTYSEDMSGETPIEGLPPLLAADW